MRDKSERQGYQILAVCVYRSLGTRPSEPRDMSENVSDLSRRGRRVLSPTPLVAVTRSADNFSQNHHAVRPAPVAFVRREEEGFGSCRSQQRTEKDLGSAVRS